jgi:hypothetical protein
MSVLTDRVRRRAGERCEYCRLPQAAFRRRFHIEHIIAGQHGGTTELDNLALACWQCNFKKGPNLSGIDPETAQVTPLFNPRKERWASHFDMQVETLMAFGIGIRGLTRSVVQRLVIGFPQCGQRSKKLSAPPITKTPIAPNMYLRSSRASALLLSHKKSAICKMKKVQNLVKTLTQSHRQLAIAE